MDRATDGDTIVRAKLEKWITEIKPRLESEHEVNTKRSKRGQCSHPALETV